MRNWSENQRAASASDQSVRWLRQHQALHHATALRPAPSDLLDLFSFDEFTFTTCGAVGPEGPDLETCRAFYSRLPEGQPDWMEKFYSMERRGCQRFRIPSNGLYEIRANGAGQTDTEGDYYGEGTARSHPKKQSDSVF